MDARTVADVEGWESRPFGGGYDGLHDLAASEFTGCVVAGDTYLFMIRGRVVGVFDYTEPSTGEPSVEPAGIERFEDADGTAYEAPHDALALLFSMAASGGETRGRYYSKKTPLEEVDKTLQDGGFTGYIELSENVLSGDYYLVYHGGRRRSVAFVGQSRRLQTDEEAFDLATDEVGIYEVNAAPFSTVEIPGSSGGGVAVSDTGSTPTGDDTGEGGTGASRDDATTPEDGPGGTDEGSDSDLSAALDDVGVASDHGDAAGTTDATGTTDAGDATTGTADDGDGEDSAPSGLEIDLDAALNPGGTDDSTADERVDEPTDPSRASPFGGLAGADEGDDPSGDPDDPGDLERPTPDRGEAGTGPDGLGESDGSDEGRVDDPDGSENTTGDDDTDGSENTTGDDDTDDTDGADNGGDTDGDDDGGIGSAAGSEEDEASQDRPRPVREATPADIEAAAAAAEAEIDTGEASDAGTDPDAGGSDGAGVGPEPPAGAIDDARVVPSVDPDRTGRGEPPDDANGVGDGADDRPMIDGETVAGLRSELSAREARIEELRERLETVQAERDDLEQRVSRLEARLAESGAAPVGNTREMSPEEALSGTSVLVRYRSKSEPTLEDAHDGGADREALAANLTLEPHPRFETEGVAISGQEFDVFLQGTRAYGFLRWLAGDLIYEIHDTGSRASLRQLYDALPALDRVEFDDTVTLDGADRETTRFDLVGRDRRDNPLFVALIENDRAPTTAETVGRFLRDATAAAESHESLVGAFAVTASYFESEALEVAEDATGGSLLSRSKLKSFVKTSRKGGYHLCLVEDREESFYLQEPDL